MLPLTRRANPVADSKTKAMPSSAKISVVNTSGKKAAVTLHTRAGMSPAKKTGAPAKPWPPHNQSRQSRSPTQQKGRQPRR